ncbi:MAG: N utilization substance protein B, partial [Deltaproteobacteria bacterium]|nr:N utilization substance protein B [Deltaproteobacteria bacterium]
MRRRARECALQILYQLDLSAGGGNGIDERMLVAELERYFTHFDPVTAEEREFAERLVRGVIAEQDAIDAAIAGVSLHWKLERM